MGRVPVDVEVNPVAVNMMTRNVLRLREWEERLRQQLYAVHAMAKDDHMTQDARLMVVENWMGFVEEVVEPLADALPEQILKKGGRPWEL
jgi:hypothetical protein